MVFFTVERVDGTSVPVTDLLACGMGQWGGLGTGVYTTAQGEPARVKTVSGLLECKFLSVLLCPFMFNDLVNR